MSEDRTGYEVRDASGKWLATCQWPEEAAILVGSLGEKGVTITRDVPGTSVYVTLWTEGVDGEAAESYTDVAEKCRDREEEKFRRVLTPAQA